MHEKKNIFTNPCAEKWADMTGDERKRMCAICQENIHSVTELDLQSVASEYVNSGKCVRMTPDQIHFFQFLRSIPKVAGLSAALTLYPFADTAAQDSIPTEEHCVIYGKVRNDVKANRTIYIIIDGQTYETKSDEHGSFKMVVPRGAKVESTNVKQLKNKRLNKELLLLNKAKLPKYIHRVIGTPSF